MKRVCALVAMFVLANVLLAPAAQAATTVMEAESATVSQGTVEANHAGYTGTGFVNYDNAIGSYVQFTLTSPGPAALSLTFRYSNGTTTNRPMDITVNGVLLTGDVAFPSTTTWDTWQTKSMTAMVASGTVTIRASATTANGGPNLDSLSVNSTPVTTDYQAESAVISQGAVESNHVGYTGTGFVNYDNVTGSYVEFSISVPVASTASLRLRYSNGTTTNRPMTISVNGTAVASGLAFGSTGTWDAWQTVVVPAALRAGANTVRATATTANGGPNLDSLTLTLQAGTFSHPGVLVSRGQLDFVKAKVAAGAQPWLAAWNQLTASSYASLTRTAHPWSVVECGPSSNPNYGCTDERQDAVAAYTCALRWYISGDKRYADKAIEIMDAWSAVLTDHTNSNAPLQTGWAGSSWSRAAELIAWTYPNWPQRSRFATMLRNVYLPEIENGAATKNGNWELVMMDATIGISVFLDDRATFDKAVGIWRGRVPAYIYVTADGSLPKSPPGSGIDTQSELVNYWQGQSTFVDGLAQETCRDFGHTGWGLAAAIQTAETARLQGLDLYAEMQTRMTKSLEFHANYELGASVPSWLCGGSVNRGLGEVLEIGYNHYANRIGLSLPATQQLVESQRPAASDNYFVSWETLTHANNA